MAIKGKGRTRSGRRVITAPPRPQLVVRKPPIWRRRSVLIGLGVVAAVGITVVVLTTLHRSHERAFKNREVAAVDTLSRQLASKLPANAQAVQPDLFVFYPSLNQDLDALAGDKLNTTKAATEAGQIRASAVAAQQGIQAISIAHFIPSDFTVSAVPSIKAKGLTQKQLIDAQFLMGKAFQLYQNVADLMKAAATAGGAQRTAFTAQAKSIFSQAGEIFDRGFRTVLDIRHALGVTGSFPTPSSSAGA